MKMIVVMVHNKSEFATVPKIVSRKLVTEGENTIVRSIVVPNELSSDNQYSFNSKYFNEFKKLLTEEQHKHGDAQLVVKAVVIEANYGSAGNVNPNFELINGILENQPDVDLYLYSSTAECLMTCAKRFPEARIVAKQNDCFDLLRKDPFFSDKQQRLYNGKFDPAEPASPSSTKKAISRP